MADRRSSLAAGEDPNRRGSTSSVVINVQTAQQSPGHAASSPHGQQQHAAHTQPALPQFTPLSPAVEPEVFEMSQHPVLDERLETVTAQVQAQHAAVNGVTQAQRQLEMQRAHMLSNDRRVVQEHFRAIEEKVEDHWQVIRVMQQQQDHILKLVHMGTKINEQDRNIRRFVQYQTDMIAQLQAPIKAQAEAMKVLQATQFRLLNSMDGAEMNMTFSSLGAMARGHGAGQFEPLAQLKCPSHHEINSLITVATDDRACATCHVRFTRQEGVHLAFCRTCNATYCLRCLASFPNNCLRGHPLQQATQRSDVRIPCASCGSVPQSGAPIISCEQETCRYAICDSCLSHRATTTKAKSGTRESNFCMQSPHALGQKTYKCSCAATKEQVVLCEYCSAAHAKAGHTITAFESHPDHVCHCGNTSEFSVHCDRHQPFVNTAHYSNERHLLGGMMPYPMHEPQDDAKELRRAIKGWGTNDKKLVHIIGTRTNKQRQAVAQEYYTLCQRDLIKDVKSDTSGNYSDLLVALLMPPAEYDATLVRDAVKGLGTDDTQLIEVLCTRTNAQIEEMKKAYKQLFSTDVEVDVRGDTSGSYQKLLLAVLQARRDSSSTVDMDMAKEDAASLYAAGEGRLGTKETAFIEILTTRNYAQLRAMFDHYAKLEDFDLEESIKRETSGNFQSALRTIVRFAKDRQKLFATLINKAMEGAGTNNSRLIRNMVARSEIDMRDIAEEYHKLRGKSLAQAIRSEVGGNFRKLLLEVLGDSGFDPQLDAKRLRSAMKGWGSKKYLINKVLSERSNAQRQDIAIEYERMYKRNLIEDLKSEAGGDYQKLLVALMTPPITFLAEEVRRAVKGLGTDDASLIELICARSAYEMRLLKDEYMKLYKKPLSQAVGDDTSGWYKKLLVSLIEVERDETGANPEQAKEVAAKLFRAGEQKWGTDEQVFIDVFTKTSYPQLVAIWDEYSKSTDFDIERSVKKETSFNFKKALLTIVQFVRDKDTYFATRLHKCMEVIGTQDYNLIRIMVTRHEVDLKTIMKAFFEKYKKTLGMMIEGDTSFMYKDLLVRLTETCKRYRSPTESEVHRARTAPSEIVINVVVGGPGGHGAHQVVAAHGAPGPHAGAQPHAVTATTTSVSHQKQQSKPAAGQQQQKGQQQQQKGQQQQRGQQQQQKGQQQQQKGQQQQQKGQRPSATSVAATGSTLAPASHVAGSTIVSAAPGVAVSVHSSGPMKRFSLVGTEVTSDGEENEPEIYFQVTDNPGHGTGTFVGHVDYGEGLATNLSGHWKGKDIEWSFVFPGDQQRYDFKGKMSLGADQTLNMGDTISGTFRGGESGTFQYQIVEYNYDEGDPRPY